MNRTFKVVFNKARGALMVANEATCSVQKKGTKLLVATAVASALSCSAMAADSWPAVPDEGTEGVVFVDNQKVSEEDYTNGTRFVYTNDGTNSPSGFFDVNAGANNTFTKEVWATASGADTQAHALYARGEGVKLTNTGSVYIQADKTAKSWKQKGMLAQDGATAINNGVIVAQNAYGMTVGTGDVASTIQNDKSITVLKEGAGMELGGADGSKAINNGTITVSDISSWGHGVLIDSNTDGVTFTNNGEIRVGDNASAIEVKDGASNTTIVLGVNSKIDGKIHYANKSEDKPVGDNHKIIAQGAVDTLNIDSNGVESIALQVIDGADITLTRGNGSWIDDIEVTNATLTTSIWQEDFELTNVMINEGGIFNVIELNSGGDKDQDAEGAKPHNRLLISYGGNYTLNGGKLYVAGEEYHGDVKVGQALTDPKETGTLTVAAGSYSFGNLEIGKTGTVNVNGGSLTVEDLAFSQGKNDNKGKVSIGENGTLTVNGKLTAGLGSASFANNGVLKTSYTNFFTQQEGEEGAAPAWATTANVDFVKGNGVIDLTDVTGTYTLDDLQKTQNQFNANSDGDNLQVIFSNAQLELDEGEDLTADSVSGLILADQVGAATEGSFTVSKNTTVAGVDFAAAETASVGASDGATLTLEGGAQDVFKFAEGSEVTSVTATNVQLGTSAASSGNVNVQTLNVKGTFDVVGNFIANEISLAEGATATVTGGLDVQTLGGAGSTTVSNNGVLTVGQLDSNVTLTQDGMLVLSEQPAVNPNARVEVEQPQVNSRVIIGGQGVGGDNILTTNKAAGDALKVAISSGVYGEGTEDYNGFYVDKTVSVGPDGYVQIGQVNRSEGIAVGSDVVTVIDMNAFSSGDVVFDAANVVFNHTGKGVLANLNSTKTVTWVNGNLEAPGNTQTVFKSSNAFLNVAFDKVAADVGAGTDAHTNLVVSVNKDVTTDAGLQGALDSVLAEGANADNQKVLAAIGSADSGFVSGNKLTAAGVQATKEYLATPVTAGTYNMAYDSAELISNALIQHNLNSKQGLGVWADVFYGSNETDTLYGNSGYSSDIYGGMIGVDYGFGEGARVGAALSIGSGDGDSEGSVSKYSTDSDFWGLSVYAGKDVGGLTFTADMSYLWLDNDISGSVAGASASESLDSTVFTLGARADWKAYEGDVMQVVPHVGVRWAQIDVDDYRGLSMDKMNVFEMPIGVTVKGNIATASGWTVTPAIDFTAAPQIGDTEVETIVGDVDVIDNVYNASIGVSAGNDAMRFGLSYKYGFGNDGRSNNTFNLKASYLF